MAEKVAWWKFLWQQKMMKTPVYDPAWWAKQVAFADELITDHNDLSWLQWWTTDEYYHLNSYDYSLIQEKTEDKVYTYNLDWTINTITFSWWRVVTYSYTDWEITSWSDTIRTWTVLRDDDGNITNIDVTAL